jgi:hypothetical protein
MPIEPHDHKYFKMNYRYKLLEASSFFFLEGGGGLGGAEREKRNDVAIDESLTFVGLETWDKHEDGMSKEQHWDFCYHYINYDK